MPSEDLPRGHSCQQHTRESAPYIPAAGEADIQRIFRQGDNCIRVDFHVQFPHENGYDE